ncbi:MAG: hypothetical protein IT492_02695 [Gammaproteobacteria bacterium]|nr:hypothetical protein [Gammaproteobacteria bacterium]
MKSLLLALALVFTVSTAWAVNVVPADEVDAVITLEDVADTETGMTGTVTNHGDVPVTEIKVLVSYGWLWKDDRRTDEASPGWTETHTLPLRLEAGQSQPFALAHEQARPQRDDGELTMSYKVLGFTRWVFQGAR